MRGDALDDRKQKYLTHVHEKDEFNQNNKILIKGEIFDKKIL